MNKLVTGWLLSAWTVIWPQLQKWLEDHKPEAEAFFDRQFDKWMPKLIAAATIAMTQIGSRIANAAVRTGAGAAEDIVDNITHAIPTEADDRLADVLLGPIFDRFKNFGILPLTAQPPRLFGGPTEDPPTDSTAR